MIIAAAVILWTGASFSAIFGGADPGLGGQPRLADLHPGRPLDRLPDRLQRDLHDPLRAADPGRAGDRPARLGLPLPQVDRRAERAARRGRDLRPLLGDHAVLHGHRGRRDRRRQRPRPRQGPALLELDRAAAAVHRRDVRRHQRLPIVIVSAVCGLAALAALLLGNRLLLRPLAALAVVAVIWGAFTAMFPYLLPTSMTISQAAAPDATLSAVFVVFGIAVVLVLPALFLLYFLAQSDFL